MLQYVTSLHFNDKCNLQVCIYICTAHENYISLTRTSKAAMSKLEFTAKEGNLFHSLIALGKKLNLKILVLAKGTLKCLLCIWRECLEGWDRFFVGMFANWLSPWLKRHKVAASLRSLRDFQPSFNR